MTLTEMGHPQPPTPTEVDNETAIGLLKSTMTQKRSKAIDMRFYWDRDRFTRTTLWSTGDQVQIMLETMYLNTIPLLIINQCAQLFLWTSFAKILLVLTQKIAYRDYLYVCIGSVKIPLWIPPLTIFQWLVRYDSYWSHKPYGTSEPPFSSTKGYLTSIK